MEKQFWTPVRVEQLRGLWTYGQSAAQIAQTMNTTRSTICAKLQRLNLKRGRKPPTAKPKIVSVPKKPTVHPASPPTFREPQPAQRRPLVRVEYSKQELRAMLAAAVRNTH